MTSILGAAPSAATTLRMPQMLSAQPRPTVPLPPSFVTVGGLVAESPAPLSAYVAGRAELVASAQSARQNVPEAAPGSLLAAGLLAIAAIELLRRRTLRQYARQRAP